jgi:hypothetical protein
MRCGCGRRGSDKYGNKTAAAREGNSPPLFCFLEAEAGDDSAHVGEALDDSGHRVVGVDLVLEVDVAFVADVDESAEDGRDRHDAVAYSDLAFFDLTVGEVLDVHGVQAGAGFLDGDNRVRSRAHSVADVDAASDAGVHVLDGFEDIERRGPLFVFGAVVVDGELDVVLLYELFDAWQDLSGGGADDDGDTGRFDVVELGTDVIVVVFIEVDGSGGGEDESGGSVLSGAGGDLVGWGHGEVDVFQVEQLAVELLHEVDEVSLIELAEGVTGDAEADRGVVSVRWGGEGKSGVRQQGGGGKHSSATDQGTARDGRVHAGIVAAREGGRPVLKVAVFKS